MKATPHHKKDKILENILKKEVYYEFTTIVLSRPCF
jgi:hypothetical protein